MQKREYFEIFERPRRLFHFSLKPCTCSPKRGRSVALLNNATHMRPVQIWVRQPQNLPVTSWDVGLC